MERLMLTEMSGGPPWNEEPQTLFEAEGNDARSVLSLAVARDAAVELGVQASFTNGQAVTVARKSGSLYALRAVPREADVF